MNHYIIISPWSRKLPNIRSNESGFGYSNYKNNPKNYPWWPEVINLLKQKVNIVQVGVDGEEKLNADIFEFNKPTLDLVKLISDSIIWMSVDNFFPHMCNAENCKPGIVLWGRSDPNIFGYDQNINLLKDRKYLRPNQFNKWEEVKYSEECFVSPETIVKSIPATIQVDNFQI